MIYSNLWCNIFEVIVDDIDIGNSVNKNFVVDDEVVDIALDDNYLVRKVMTFFVFL